MLVLIMAGGEGTRLRLVEKNRSSLSAAGRYLVCHRHFLAAGATPVVVTSSRTPMTGTGAGRRDTISVESKVPVTLRIW